MPFPPPGRAPLLRTDYTVFRPPIILNLMILEFFKPAHSTLPAPLFLNQKNLPQHNKTPPTPPQQTNKNKKRPPNQPKTRFLFRRVWIVKTFPPYGHFGVVGIFIAPTVAFSFPPKTASRPSTSTHSILALVFIVFSRLIFCRWEVASLSPPTLFAFFFFPNELPQ